MKQYRVELAFPGQNENAVNLVNVNDPDDVIMGAEDEFFVGDLVFEDQFEMKSHSYVNEQSAGSAYFAFKKQSNGT